MLQLAMGTLLSAVFLLFQVQAAPYVAMADDFLASAASFSLVAIFLCSYAFKVRLQFLVFKTAPYGVARTWPVLARLH